MLNFFGYNIGHFRTSCKKWSLKRDSWMNETRFASFAKQHCSAWAYGFRYILVFVMWPFFSLHTFLGDVCDLILWSAGVYILLYVTLLQLVFIWWDCFDVSFINWEAAKYISDWKKSISFFTDGYTEGGKWWPSISLTRAFSILFYILLTR